LEPLHKFDVVIVSKNAFEKCEDSPFLDIHWLRVIVDEGHEFSSASSNAVLRAAALYAERRWIVSGTPARDKLFGVEVETAADADMRAPPSTRPGTESLNTPPSENLVVQKWMTNQKILERRKAFSQDEAKGTNAARSIGLLAKHFLKMQPWASESGSWDSHIYRHERFRSRTNSAFSVCFRTTMESLVIKTRPEDVDQDLFLPPLTHDIIRLEPSFYDKLTVNIFTLTLTTNAVASERTGVDYIFSTKSAPARHQLITNLRQANFFWTGFSTHDVESAMKVGREYLSKKNSNCSEVDRKLLSDCIRQGEFVLQSAEWKAMSFHHELGLFLNKWVDQDSLSAWALSDSPNPIFMGTSQLLKAQRIINDQLFDEDPLAGLEAAGAVALEELAVEWERSLWEPKKDRKKKGSKSSSNKLGVPSSGIQDDKRAFKLAFSVNRKAKQQQTPAKNVPPVPKDTSAPAKDAPAIPKRKSTKAIKATKANLKRKRDMLDQRELPSDSALKEPCIIGTVSAKLTYLLNRVTALYEKEKIIIFYDGDNTAYYLAQCFDLLHIKHLIYAKSLAADQKSKYVVSFNGDETIRVLLMDIRTGAFGLNVNAASRVFFLNPVCRPSTEAQAIKRAHRIGQTKPVYVETLVLKGTIEEKLFERSNSMTQAEHQEASQLSDDAGIARIIQEARGLDVCVDEGQGLAQMVALEKPVQIFGRKGRGDMRIEGIDLFDDEAPVSKRSKLNKDFSGVSGAVEDAIAMSMVI